MWLSHVSTPRNTRRMMRTRPLEPRCRSSSVKPTRGAAQPGTSCTRPSSRSSAPANSWRSRKPRCAGRPDPGADLPGHATLATLKARGPGPAATCSDHKSSAPEPRLVGDTAPRSPWGQDDWSGLDRHQGGRDPLRRWRRRRPSARGSGRRRASRPARRGRLSRGSRVPRMPRRRVAPRFSVLKRWLLKPCRNRRPRINEVDMTDQQRRAP
jgi:hypothetical protein